MARVNLCLYPSGCNYGILYALHTMYILCIETLLVLQLKAFFFFPEVSNFP